MGHGPGMWGNWKGEGEKGLGVKEVGGESGVRALESDIRYAFEHIGLNTSETRLLADIPGGAF